MELLEALGFNWVTFFSQLINFAILYFVLNKFALKKIHQTIINRQRQIADGIKNANLAATALDQAKAQQAEILTAARHEAKQIVSEGRALGKKQADQIIAQAKTQAQAIIDTGEKQLAVAKNKMILEVKSELVDLIAVGVQRVVGEQIKPQVISERYLDLGLKA